MRRVYAPQKFGSLDISDKGWQRYTHLEGEERATFIQLIKSPRTAFLLALFFGGLGAHRFYLGHVRIGAGLLGLTIVSFVTGSTPLFLATSVIVLIEIGHIVRTTEQWNDSIEGAIMLGTHNKPLFKDAKP